MTQGKIPLTFQIYSGGQLVRTEELAQDIIKVGKLQSSHLRIDDENVSRMHAVIEVQGPEEVHIIDLGSASGTIVNGKKVNKAKLRTGDEVQLGDTKVIVEIGRAAAGDDDDAATKVAPIPAAPAAAAPPPMRAAAPAAAPAARPAPAAAAAAPAAAPAAAAPQKLAPPTAAKPAAAVPNPFAAKAAMPNPFSAKHGLFDEEDPSKHRYGIAASGPPISPDEVEVPAQAVEVVVMWGTESILHVEHLSPARSFFVGEPEGKIEVDFLMGSEALGTSRMPVVVAGGGSVAAVIPHGATGEVHVGDQTILISRLAAEGRLQPCSEMTGAMQYPLPEGASAKVEHRGFTFVTKPVRAGKKVAAGFNVDPRPVSYIGGAMALCLIFLITMYFFPPAPGALSLDMIDPNSRLVQYLMEPPATEEEPPPDWMQQSKANDTAGGQGERHKGDEGQMGKQESKRTNNRYAIQGDANPEDQVMAREAALEQARNAGILGTLAAMNGAFNSPTSPFGAEQAIGADPMSALGALMGDQIGENFGFGGLGLRGTGRGGGGTGEGTIGLGNFGTIGHGGGTGTGSGYGAGAGGFHGREARVPQIRSGNAEVRGSLSKEVIRRVILRHINEVRFCYEQELNQRPDLEGRVAVRFIIAATGAVQLATVSESSLGSARAEQCIAAAVRRWTFPAPDGGGIVIVNYPFMLTAAGGE